MKQSMLGLSAALVLGLSLPALAKPPNVAVFNFQMKSRTPDWIWLEKGLADRITTDFSRSKKITLVARDEMQRVAAEVNWAPEMATKNPERMGKIRGQLRIRYLVSGVYSLADGRITVTAQIVNVATRKELARKQLAGEADKVLDLQRRLSAELLNWFTKQPVEEILPTLPVWTRSLPAVKSLYEGMHLYDQGRYPEAWLLFRKAARKDPEYVESRYWLGKMYYFMDRYRHARRALEKFVYMDRTHPRMGDAVLEYIHTYEKTDTSGELLLQLYADFRKRFGRLPIMQADRYRSKATPCGQWLKEKSAKLLAQMGRYGESALLSGAMIEEHAKWNETFAHNAVAHSIVTGETFVKDKLLADPSCPRSNFKILVFQTSRRRFNEFTFKYSIPPIVMGKKNGLPLSVPAQRVFDRVLVAPSGYVFKSLRFQPHTEGDGGVLNVELYRTREQAEWNYPIRYGPRRSLPLAEAKKKFVIWDRFFPPPSYVRAECSIASNDFENGPLVRVIGITVLAELARRDRGGAIDVKCLNAVDFSADVDGVRAGSSAGLIGPLTPGKHTVTIRPASKDSPYGPWTTKVTVRHRQTTPVTVRLPWKRNGAWRRWTPSASMPSPGLFDVSTLGILLDSPAVQVDAGAIRMVWHYKGDLWASESADGNAFSPARQLPLPVSSGWTERKPKLLRDESGRFVLTFLSDRDGQHRMLPYLSWSRDFVTWSAPALIVDKATVSYDLLQDTRGRFILVQHKYPAQIQIFASRNGYRWTLLSRLPSRRRVRDRKFSTMEVEIVQRGDGRYELFVRGMLVAERGGQTEIRAILRYLSADASSWGKPTLWDVKRSRARVRPTSISAIHVGGRTTLGLFQAGYHHTYLALLREQHGGAWHKTRRTPGGVPSPGTIAHDPRWGYLIAWRNARGILVFRGKDIGSALSPMTETAANESAGPQRPSRGGTSGERVRTSRARWSQRILPANAPARLRERRTPSGPPEPYAVWRDASPQEVRTRTMKSYGPGGHVLQTYQVLAHEDDPPPVPTRAPGDWPVGRLMRVAGDRGEQILPADLIGERKDFSPAKGGSGITSAKAIAGTLASRGFRLSVALDSQKNPNANTPQMLRLDLTGTKDFKNGYRVGAAGAVVQRSPRMMACSFVGMPFYFPVGDWKVPAGLWCTYVTSPAAMKMRLNLATAADGRCRFAAKVHRVRLIDNNSNLTVRDAPRGKFEGGAAVGVDGDVFFVDVGKGDLKDYVRAFYGQPVLVDGKLHELEFSPKTLDVSAKAYDGKTGMVKIDDPHWELWLVDKKRAMIVSGSTAPVPVPIGRYNVWKYVLYRSVTTRGHGQWARLEVVYDKGPWKNDRWRGPQPIVDITAGKTAAPKIGGPFTSAEVVRGMHGNDWMYVDLYWKDVRGAWVSRGQWTEGFSPPGPTLVISDAQGKTVTTLWTYWETGNGQVLHCFGRWVHKKRVKGTFTLKIIKQGLFPVRLVVDKLIIK